MAAATATATAFEVSEKTAVIGSLVDAAVLSESVLMLSLTAAGAVSRERLRVMGTVSMVASTS